MSSIELVVTDLDGTLWSYDTPDIPHPSAVAAWLELERRGIPVVVATGRRVASTRAPLATVGLAPNAVVLNGALALDLASDERYHWSHHDPLAAQHALGVFQAHGLDPCVYVDESEVDIYLTSTPATAPEHVAQFGVRARIAELDSIISDRSVLSLAAFGFDRSMLDEIAAELDGRCETHIVPDMFSEHWGITVTPVGLSKWSGVLASCERHDVDASRVLAIGDGVNDIELLTHAAVGLAMADGESVAHAAADHIVPSVADDGWSTILDFV